jgi:hypothetical protein
VKTTMTDLLKKSWNEVANRPLVLLQCFWPLIVLYCVVNVLAFAGKISEYEAIIGRVVAVALTVGAGAVRWHRHVIADETVTWMPRLPDALALSYVAKLIGLTFAFTVMQKVATSIAQDLFSPILGLALGGQHQQLAEFVVSALAIVLLLSSFVLLLGTWMLQLPEGALGSTGLSVRKDWQPGGRQSYLRALSAIYIVPAIADLALPFLLGTDSGLIESVAVWAFTICLNLLAAILALSLLTVTYRGQLDRSGMSFGRKNISAA